MLSKMLFQVLPVCVHAVHHNRDGGSAAVGSTHHSPVTHSGFGRVTRERLILALPNDIYYYL